ncbi:MAG TPA: adenylate/guanylate cyclase domain-containing protein [Thermoleophilaceae bacterium]|nr:adenylate/guanylate cyclase domain-containing protein [Thermoleophilaceae bacterium]
MPKARYAKSGDVNIAYVTVGDGPVNLVWVPTWISQCEYLFEEPSVAAAFERLGEFATVALFDRRGSGLSDPMAEAPMLEEQMDDVLAVMDAVGFEQAAVSATIEGGPMGALFAATRPDRCERLVLYSAFARSLWAPDYDWTWKPDEREERSRQMVAHWGDGLMAGAVAASRQSDPAFMDWAGRLERLAASPATAERILELIGQFDVRHVLPSIRVPTLVLHRPADGFLDVRHSRYLAEHIPDARLVELEGTDHLFSLGDVDTLIGEIEEFLTGHRREREPDRLLATVLFTDICHSTERAAALGDSAWKSLLSRHDELVRRELSRHRGREVKHTGDGFLATFDGPARGVRCAQAISEGMKDLGMGVRAGVHTGELEIRDSDVGGIAVHIGARVMAKAEEHEVLASSTVKDLVVGSGLDFSDRGFHELRGVPGEWRLFAVA